MELPKSKSPDAFKKFKEDRSKVYEANKNKVVEHLQKRGLRKEAIAAMLANIDVETGGSFDFTQKQTVSGRAGDPRIVKGGGVGLFQFDDYQKGVGNESWYKEYLKDSGKKDSTESQIDYVLDAIYAESDEDVGWKSKLKIGKGDLEVLKQYLDTTENPRDISDAFEDRFENAGIPHADKRRNRTDKYFKELSSEQNINQDEPIQDVGEDIPMEDEKFPMERVQDIPEEKSMYETIKPYVPVLRHFNEGGAVPMQKQMEMFDEGGLSTKKDSIEDLVDTFEITPEIQESMDKMTKEEQDAIRKKLIAEAMERMLDKPLPKDIDRSKIARQYNEGGLMDEGGTVDPVSGNDVPPGSTQEEVRDDIPAQLSEGEFVFPADVVRFIGLNNLMQMRQQAKMGLKQMEEMGQMGNSDEATMPDDLPFDINDLDMEDEDEYNTRQEFAVGGMPTPNPNTGVYYNPTTTAPTTGVAAVPQQAASSQYVQPVQAAVPTDPVYKPAEIPTFKGFVGENVPGVDFEYVEYKNEAGNVIKLRKSKTTGDLLDPVPEGYTFVDPEATKVEEATVAPTTPQTTTVREDKGDADHAMKEEEMYGPGGGRLGVGGTVYGVSFDGMGTLPGPAGALQGAFGLATGKPLPIGATVTMQTPQVDAKGNQIEPDIFTLTSTQYKELKNAIDNTPGGANSNKVKNLLDSFKSKGRARHSVDTHIKNMSSFTDSKEMKNVLDTYRDDMEKQIEIGNVKEDGSIINPFEMPGARGGGSDTGFAGTEGSQQRAAESAANAARDAALAEDGPDRGPQTGGGPSQDDAPASDGSEQQSDGYGGLGHATGGLISKPKPKVKKKMKRGGLASKK